MRDKKWLYMISQQKEQVVCSQSQWLEVFPQIEDAFQEVKKSLNANSGAPEIEITRTCNGVRILSIQINISHGNSYRDLDGRSRLEGDAVLAYGISESGSIIVSLYPHTSTILKVRSDFYIIDHSEDPGFLNGKKGRIRMRTHWYLLCKLSEITNVNYLPQKRGGKFLEKLDASSNKFKSIFDGLGEKRKSYFQFETSFAAGLVGGLIASTIFPLLLEIGKDESSSAMRIMDICNKPNFVVLSRCLAGRDYTWHNNIGNLLSPIVLFGIAVVLVIFILAYIIKSFKKS